MPFALCDLHRRRGYGKERETVGEIDRKGA
jgi:hypothetical protein